MIIEFIIPTYDRKYQLGSMLASLIAQNNPNWKASVMIDSPEKIIADEILEIFTDSRITKIHMTKRYNDWGHTPREIGKQQATGDYIIMTGDDNYYTPNLVDEIITATKTNPGLIYWNMVHNYFQYSAFYCSLANWQIDMGAFATRNDIAKQIHLQTTKIDADGHFIEEFKKRFPNELTIKIDKILFIHN